MNGNTTEVEEYTALSPALMDIEKLPLSFMQRITTKIAAMSVWQRNFTLALIPFPLLTFMKSSKNPRMAKLAVNRSTSMTLSTRKFVQRRDEIIMAITMNIPPIVGVPAFTP